MRIDVALVEKGLFDTRSRAKDAILSGIVFYNNKQILKPSFDVQNIDLLVVQGNVMPYVSRGGLKLERALDVFGINLSGKVVVDIGSSTGGFTDCALQHGVGRVIAIDTGTDQMHQSLRNNPKIELYEQTDFRTIDDNIVVPAQIATIDVSFISVLKILDKLKTLPNLTGVICLIKPQFECGPEISERYRGVVLNKNVHIDVIRNVINGFNKIGFGLVGLTYSPIQGGSGNIEYLGCFVRGAENTPMNIPAVVDDAFAVHGVKK
ncbi:MAG: TlyA family RNA methyltransferase [Proteobacteria bacterium]|nr:TlyA family RNA methyltransferase [Candidatus Enterousia scatequi]